MPAARSYLYVPGDKPEVLAKALGRGADALIVDLEDAVAPGAKDEARDVVRRFLADLPAAVEGEVELWVRVNGDGLAGRDIEAVASPALTGFCLAKTESPDDVDAAAEACGRAEDALGLPPGTFALAPLLESASAVLDARAIASASPRVVRLQVGEADLRADIGVTLGQDERELLHVRSSIVLASAAAGIEPPVGPVSTNFRDLDALRDSTQALARLGYRGRACIHPAQAAVVNAVFTPSEDELAAARSLIERYDAALAAGEGVFTDDNGRMVDLAVIRQARRTLALAR
ncbi:MAG: CoA ester lyase [Candidatus Nanopelagicales bacterium]